jgi:hypothetical protein
VPPEIVQPEADEIPEPEERPAGQESRVPLPKVRQRFAEGASPSVPVRHEETRNICAGNQVRVVYSQERDTHCLSDWGVCRRDLIGFLGVCVCESGVSFVLPTSNGCATMPQRLRLHFLVGVVWCFRAVSSDKPVPHCMKRRRFHQRRGRLVV